MGASEPTAAEVGHDLAILGNYRVLRVQQLAERTFLHPSILLSLGLRETGLKNVCGGATFKEGKWVESFTDRGYLQISDQFPENAQWLSTQEGCANGQWGPDAQHRAIDPMHCPRFSPATEYVLREFQRNRTEGLARGVKEADITRFCVAAHNAGFSGALVGYREGNVDKNTALGDYSAWVLKYSTVIHNWVVAHPAWVYKGQQL